MKNIKTTYIKTNTIDFFIDKDPELTWIGKFKSDYNRFFLVIDKNVKKIWGNKIENLLKKHNKEIFIFEVDAIEKSKSTDFYPNLVSFLEKNKANLGDLVIGVGGGIIIDLVSFTCSTYMRGLPLYLIPTTLIGMIDASTAGKTCLSTPENKNILGTFYYPEIVYNNINFLKTYSWYHHRQGLSESYKYGILTSKKLVSALTDYIGSKSTKNLLTLVEYGLEARVKIRNIHPQASNLGHTFGHALEKLTNYKILHGDAITAGTYMALRYGERVGVNNKKVSEAIIAEIKKLNLNLYIPKDIDVEKMIDLMMSDKKSTSTHMNLVLLERKYHPYTEKKWPFYKAKPGDVKKFLKEFMKTYPYAIKNVYKVINTDNIVYKE